MDSTAIYSELIELAIADNSTGKYGSSLLVMLKTLINSSNRLLGKKDSF